MRFETWNEFMAEQRRTGLLQRISDFVTAEREKAAMHRLTPSLPRDNTFPAVYPASADVMRFTTTPLRQVRVVILGQDPYHQPGQAHGLAFSYKGDEPIPASLRNIFKELMNDLGDNVMLERTQRCVRQGPRGIHGDLTPWTRQGVLLLNTALTVRHGEPGSHLSAWQPFTDEVVQAVVDSADVAPHFILWGSKAKSTLSRVLGRLVSLDHVLKQPGFVGHWNPGQAAHLITATYSAHPSPLSADRGFFGSRPFSRANLALRLNNPGVDCAVDWRLP